MSENSFVTRDYKKADVPRILQIIKTAFAEQKGIVFPASSAESKTVEIVENELQSANALVVESDDVVIACVFYHEKNQEIYIDRLAVLPDLRKRGLGALLMNEIENRAVSLGIQKLSLSVRIELTNQQNYYRKMGYEISSYESHEGFEKPTYVMMEKLLTFR